MFMLTSQYLPSFRLFLLRFSATVWNIALLSAPSVAPLAQAQDAALTPAAPPAIVVGALGDSISAGFNASHLGDNRELSWSTGNSPQINSHAKRLANHLRRPVVTFNEAVVGSEARDLGRQVERLVPHRPAYVTITIGSNDICHWDPEWEDNLAAYETKVRSALSRLVEANQEVKVVLTPIPDLYNLWEVTHTQFGCQAKWDLLSLCRPLLHSSATTNERLAFKQRWDRTNQALERISHDYQQNVLFNLEWANKKFDARHVSSMDCFHPSIAGQNLLADMAWQLITGQ